MDFVIKIKTSDLRKTMLKDYESESQRKYLQKICLKKDCYPKHIRNCSNLAIKPSF